MTDAPSLIIDPAAQARNVARSLLRSMGQPFTPQKLRIAASAGAAAAQAAAAAMGDEVTLDADALYTELEGEVNVLIGRESGLDDLEGHVDWLPGKRGVTDWRFWDRYRQYLETSGKIPQLAIDRLDTSTDEILGRLEDPVRPGPWDRRGMIVGQVQAGKTGHYTGLICKAADAGYKLVIVLAGLHNSLRSQTQYRLDEGFLGFDTREARFYDAANIRMGAGLIDLQGRRLPVHSVTTSDEKGDFRVAQARRVRGIGSDPVLLVVKKHKSILENVIKWAGSLDRVPHPVDDRMVVPDLPLLVIDDEADNASLNTRDTRIVRDAEGIPQDEIDPTAINQKIRELLYHFLQSAYVSYTATPFANLYVYDGEPSPTFGEDLFPRSFIRSIPSPSNYVGATKLFGEPDSEGRMGLPTLDVYRRVKDAEAWLPDRHDKTAIPGTVPASLRRAMISFILVSAARAARGQQRVHNSMLVHVTRFQDVQERISAQVREELREIRGRLSRGDGARTPTILDELKGVWDEDFVPRFGALAAALEDPQLRPVDWAQLLPHLKARAGAIEVLTINGRATDALEYVKHPYGYSAVVIGGDKLSRGLTLEGLSVSYYLRGARAYDTLLQMGRWFGYRPGYGDLCRLYTSEQLMRAYRRTTLANEDLLDQLREMAAQGATPTNFGLRVRADPDDALLVTAPAKMRHGRPIRLTYSGAITETIHFSQDAKLQRANADSIVEFLREQESHGRRLPDRQDNLLWGEVPGRRICDLLAAVRFHPDATRARPEMLAQYILGRVRRLNELTSWTVALINRKAAPTSLEIDGLGEIGLTERTEDEQILRRASDTFVIRRLVNPPDERLDLDDDELSRAATLSRRRFKEDPGRRTRAPKGAQGPEIRTVRPPSRGLMLIYPLDPNKALMPARDVPAFGLAISFPHSSDPSGEEYVATRVYVQQMELDL